MASSAGEAWPEGPARQHVDGYLGRRRADGLDVAHVAIGRQPVEDVAALAAGGGVALGRELDAGAEIVVGLVDGGGGWDGIGIGGLQQ
ncbi:hypothetical protein Q3H58_004098 [Pseudomonas psychrotolerans]|nr:hypothetical protein [Pseudomonas psychrotolerans]